MSNSSLDEELESLRKELRGTQEMLAMVLKSVGEPVVVTKSLLADGLPDGTQIRVDESLADESFVFSLEFPVGVNDSL